MSLPISMLSIFQTCVDMAKTARVSFRHHGNAHQVQPSRPYRRPNLGKNASQEVRMVAEMNSHSLHLFHKGSSQAQFTPDRSRYTAVSSP